MDERLINLETKITEQEHTIEELNSVVYAQQKQIDILESKVATLIKRFKDYLDGNSDDIRGNEKPPHY